jgi:hypothetical protein
METPPSEPFQPIYNCPLLLSAAGRVQVSCCASLIFSNPRAVAFIRLMISSGMLLAGVVLCITRGRLRGREMVKRRVIGRFSRRGLDVAADGVDWFQLAIAVNDAS